MAGEKISLPKEKQKKKTGGRRDRWQKPTRGDKRRSHLSILVFSYIKLIKKA